MSIHELINKLSSRRQELWKRYEDSWIKETQKYGIEEPKEIDILGEEILMLLQQNFDKLPVDFIIEELTKLGHAPSVVYDDNGHFAVTGDGYASISDEPQNAGCFMYVSKSQWKLTIREALRHYMFNPDEKITDEYVYDANDNHEYFSNEYLNQLDVLPDDFFKPENEE